MPGVPGIQSYTSVAASNTTWFPEGMAPSAVNDGMRQVQADLRNWYTDAEWVNLGDTPSRASATTFKVTGDVTSKYPVNSRMKLYDATTLYGVVTAISYSAPDTTVTVGTDSGSLTASLSSFARSIISPSNISIPTTIGRKGADIASATTTDLSVATGDYVDITGTTTITGFGTVAAGVMRTVRFTGALTLTHNATSLILPGAANITTAANDTAIFRSLGSGNWLCISYKKADGTAVVGGSAPGDASYITLGTNGTLTNERVLTAGSGVTLTDAGAGSTVTIAKAAGSVLQCLQATKTGVQTITSGTSVDVSGLSISITPASSSNKILVFWSVNANASGTYTGTKLALVRTSTEIFLGDSAASRVQATHGLYASDANNGVANFSGMYLDSPATTSATTYKIVAYDPSSGAGSIYINQNPNDTTGYTRDASSITVMEIKG